MTEDYFQRLTGLLAVGNIAQIAATLMASDKELSPREAVEKAYALRREAGNLVAEEYQKRQLPWTFGHGSV